jgi:hypothetical protein
MLLPVKESAPGMGLTGTQVMAGANRKRDRALVGSPSSTTTRPSPKFR